MTGPQQPIPAEPANAADPNHVAEPVAPVEDIRSSDELPAEEMDQLIASGQAEHLAEHVIDYATWDGSWWTFAAGEMWLRIDDPELHATLDRYHRRMKAGLFG